MFESSAASAQRDRAWTPGALRPHRFAPRCSGDGGRRGRSCVGTGRDRPAGSL